MLKKVFFFVFFAMIVNVGILTDAQDKKPEPKKISVNGTIEDMDMEKGLAKIVDGDETEWIVKLDRNTKFTYSGTAEPAWIRRGMWVRLTTDFNSKGEPQRSPKDVLVFQRKKGDKLGIYNDNKGTIINPFIKSKTEPTPSEKFLTLTVAGQVKSLRSSELSVVAGRMTLKIPLDKRTKIRVDVADPTLIRKGDKVMIEGWQVPDAENAMVATSLKVTGKEPLAPKGRRTGSRTTKSDEKK